VASLTLDEYFVLKEINRAIHLNFPEAKTGHPARILDRYSGQASRYNAGGSSGSNCHGGYSKQSSKNAGTGINFPEMLNLLSRVKIIS